MPGPHRVSPAVEIDAWTHHAAGEVSIGQPFGGADLALYETAVIDRLPTGATTQTAPTARRPRSRRSAGVSLDER
jgi:hypothetical protein